MNSDSEKSIWLIGSVISNLPDTTVTVRDMLRVYYYYRTVLLKERNSCINSLAKNLQAHHLQIGISTIEPKDISRKINKAVREHESYKKIYILYMYRESKTQKSNEKKFVDFLGSRFDIFPKPNYHHDMKIKIQTMQEKLEPGSAEVQRCDLKIISEEVQRFDVNANSNASCLEEFIDEDDVMECDQQKEDDVDFETTLSKYQRCQLSSESVSKPGFIQKIVDSPDVSSVLDRTGYSAPKFTLLCAAMAGAVGKFERL